MENFVQMEGAYEHMEKYKGPNWNGYNFGNFISN